jgi:hypothetical protein
MARTIKQRDINLLTALDSKPKAKRLSPLVLITPLAIVVFVVFAAGFYLSQQNIIFELEAEVAEVQRYNNDPSTNSQITQAQRASEQASTMQKRAADVAAPIQNLTTYPDLSAENYRTIYSLRDPFISIDNFSYDRTTGILTFRASSEQVNGVPYFIRRLRDTGIFVDISYSGYDTDVTTIRTPTTTTTTNEDGERVVESSESVSYETKYIFNVECAMAPHAALVITPAAQQPAEETAEQPAEGEAPATEGGE